MLDGKITGVERFCMAVVCSFCVISILLNCLFHVIRYVSDWNKSSTNYMYVYATCLFYKYLTVKFLQL